MGVGTIVGMAVVVIAVGVVSKWGVGKVRKLRSERDAEGRQKQRVRRREALRRGR
jgi:hypothetical protein